MFLTYSPPQYFTLVLLPSGSIYFIALITDISGVPSNIQGLFSFLMDVLMAVR